MTIFRKKIPTHAGSPVVKGIGSRAVPERPQDERTPEASSRPAAARYPELSRATLERVRAGDPSALAQLFEACFDRVYSLAYQLLGEHALAEDVSQDVFLKVHRSVGQLDPARDPGPWLTAITYNACRDVWRSRSYQLARHPSAPEASDAASRTLAAGTEDPECLFLAKERERLVQEALLRLPETFRVLVILHDYQGLSHDEIAVLTGLSHAAVRKRYSRALASLGKLLRKSIG